MNLVAYSRVSSSGQLDGLRLEVQHAAIAGWAKHNRHKIVMEYQDAAVSGTLGVADRPALSAALSFLRSPGRAEGLVVARLDRLARSLMMQESILELLWRQDAVVFSAETGEVHKDDQDDPTRQALRLMLGVWGGLERGLAVKRLADGRRAKAAAGLHAVGQHPYGCRSGGKGADSVIDPIEQQALNKIIELRSAGQSYRAICAALDAEGLTPRRAERWSPMSVRRIVLRAGLT